MVSTYWMRNESHFFQLGKQAFLYEVKSSCLFQLSYPCDLIWQACRGQTKAEIIEGLMAKGCSEEELRDAWSELESRGLVVVQSSISAQLPPTPIGITSLYVQIYDPQTRTTLTQATASKILTWLIAQSLPGQRLSLVLDLQNSRSPQLLEYEVVKYIVDWIQTISHEISCAIKLDACQLTQSVVSLINSNQINPVLMMGRFFLAKRREPTTYLRTRNYILELHQHQRSVAFLSLSSIPTTHDLEIQLSEIRHMGFKAFYIQPTPSFFPSFAPACEGSTYLAWAQPYIKVIRKAVRPYFVFANAIFQQQPVKRYYKCQAGITHLAVSTKGEFYPCVEFIAKKLLSLGNVEDINEILSTRTTFTGRHVDNNDVCRECWARYCCGGECAYYTSQSHGMQVSPQSPNCDFTRSNLEQLLLAKYAARNAASDLLVKLWYGTLLPYMPHLGSPLNDGQRPNQISFRAKGSSMLPTIKENEQVEAIYLHPNDAQAGDIILFERESAIIAHRLLRKFNNDKKVMFVEKGDGLDQDHIIDAEKVFAKVVAIERRDLL